MNGLIDYQNEYASEAIRQLGTAADSKQQRENLEREQRRRKRAALLQLAGMAVGTAVGAPFGAPALGAMVGGSLGTAVSAFGRTA